MDERALGTVLLRQYVTSETRHRVIPADEPPFAVLDEEDAADGVDGGVGELLLLFQIGVALIELLHHGLDGGSKTFQFGREARRQKRKVGLLAGAHRHRVFLDLGERPHHGAPENEIGEKDQQNIHAHDRGDDPNERVAEVVLQALWRHQQADGSDLIAAEHDRPLFDQHACRRGLPIPGDESPVRVTHTAEGFIGGKDADPVNRFRPGHGVDHLVDLRPIDVPDRERQRHGELIRLDGHQVPERLPLPFRVGPVTDDRVRPEQGRRHRDQRGGNHHSERTVCAWASTCRSADRTRAACH